MSNVDQDTLQRETLERVCDHLDVIYHEVPLTQPLPLLARELSEAIANSGFQTKPDPYLNKWDQRDAVLITYADSIRSDKQHPFQCLNQFLDHHVGQTFSAVHVLPFFPFSSDDGFAVIDFSSVNEALGSWEDVREISGKYKLMSDLVINHCSSQGKWFDNFRQGRSPGAGYFITADPNDDLSAVVRPRTSDLLRETETSEGVKHVWCTFSDDQVDLNFRNPEVLLQMVRLIRLYLDMGVRIFRLDAVAFIWKEVGTNCLNLDQAHEIVRLLRTLIDAVQDDVVIITETNIPNRENLSYFGNANEAHCIYNFSLPPLLLQALVTGSCRHLKQWIMSMPPAVNGTAYLNFIASHDGIGLRPAEGLLSTAEIETLIECMQSFGGFVSWRAESGQDKPYEINISLYDALRGTVNGEDGFRDARFLLAHTIMLSLEGIPAFYIHSFLATENDTDRARHTGNNRAINRHQWNQEKLNQLLNNPSSPQARISGEITRLICLRGKQPAFHPNATQFTLHLGDEMFGFWRQSSDRSQSVFCIFNMTADQQQLNLADINLIETDNWQDLLAGERYSTITDSVLMKPYQALWVTNRILES